MCIVCDYEYDWFDDYEWYFLNLMMIPMMFDVSRYCLGLVWMLWMIRNTSIVHRIHDVHRFSLKETLLKLHFDFDI